MMWCDVEPGDVDSTEAMYIDREFGRFVLYCIGLGGVISHQSTGSPVREPILIVPVASPRRGGGSGGLALRGVLLLLAAWR